MKEKTKIQSKINESGGKESPKNKAIITQQAKSLLKGQDNAKS